MRITYYIVDAFTDTPFKGNPASVCIVEEKVEDEIMQKIALEFSLSETAFVRPKILGSNFSDTKQFILQWFTPKTEVSLCGHATLATSKVLFDIYKNNNDVLEFDTKSGCLYSSVHKKEIVLDFKAYPPAKTKREYFKVIKALGITGEYEIYNSCETGNLMIVLSDPEELVNIEPNFNMLLECEISPFTGLIVTANEYNEYDFISRYFAPWEGINEDPVTGSAHTVLTPYWASIQKKSEFKVYQASNRGGEIRVTLQNNRIRIMGEAVIIAQGVLQF